MNREQRIEYMMERYGMSRAEATAAVEQEDRDAAAREAAGGESGSEESDDTTWLEDAGSAIVSGISNAEGWLTGRTERESRERIRQENMGLWDELTGGVPSRLYEEEQSDAALAAADPEAIAAQKHALSELQRMGAGHYSDIDRARQERALRRNAQQERSQREAALSRLQSQGMGQSGVSALAALQAQQGAANRSSDEAMNIEALAQQRALQAMQGAGGMAGQMRGQSFDERYRRGTAMDDWRRRNTDRRNQHQQQRFENQRSIVAGKTGQFDRASEDSRFAEEQKNQQVGTALTALGYVI